MLILFDSITNFVLVNTVSFFYTGVTIKLQITLTNENDNNLENQASKISMKTILKTI